MKILECADPGGAQANLPKDDSTCDGNTIQGISILIGSDGSFSDTTYQVYMLPSQTLGEQSNFKPICNQTNDCVLYVGQNQNDFTAPKVFSAPFLISPGSGAATTTFDDRGGLEREFRRHRDHQHVQHVQHHSQNIRLVGRRDRDPHRRHEPGQYRRSGRHRLDRWVRHHASPHWRHRAPPGHAVGAMSTVAPERSMPTSAHREDIPIDLNIKPVGADRIFNGVLASSSGFVLALLSAVVVFLCYYGFEAFREGGFGLFTDPTWSPDSHHFGMMSLLVGSIAIALIAVALAAPISLAAALMINEYAPRQMKAFLTGVIDMLATVPSIVYGFWGLLLISNLQAAPARWLVTHASFVPIFRSVSPTQFVKSIFACGLICAVTIIPIITSISREVMAQAPRDVCEAALALGARVGEW